MSSNQRYRSGIFRNALALEAEVSDGKVSKEIEHMFYARVDDVTILMNAEAVEVQEQWGLWTPKTSKNVGSGSVRIRKTITRQIQDGAIRHETAETQYVMTTKIKTSTGDSLEIPIPTTEHNLQAFKLLAESGMVKHRYRYPVPGTKMVWEVDMFLKPGEDVMSAYYLPICKIDLEVDDINTPLPAFPVGFMDPFNAKDKDLTPEQLAIVDDMKKYLSLPNPHLVPMYKGV